MAAKINCSLIYFAQTYLSALHTTPKNFCIAEFCSFANESSQKKRNAKLSAKVFLQEYCKRVKLQ